jgi:hypothetical protein
VYKTHQMEKEVSVRGRSVHNVQRRTQDLPISQITEESTV